MYGMRSESIRVRRARSPLHTASPAARDNLNAVLQHNVVTARVIAFETSPMRILTRHAYKNALVATRRLTADVHNLRKAASSSWQKRTVDEIDKVLRQCRIHAMIKSSSVSVAQDVFVLLSQYLGICAVPDKFVVRQLAADVPVHVPAAKQPNRMPRNQSWFRRSVSHKQVFQTSLSTTSLQPETFAHSRSSHASLPNVYSNPNLFRGVNH